MALGGLVAWEAGAGGGRLAHPLAVLPAEELGWAGPGPLLGGVLHAHALRLLHQAAGHGLGEGGESADQGGALLEEDPDGEQGHAGTLSLEGQVEAPLGQGAQFKGLHVEFPLAALPQEKVRSHCVHLQQEEGGKGVHVMAGFQHTAFSVSKGPDCWFSQLPGHRICFTLLNIFQSMPP